MTSRDRLMTTVQYGQGIYVLCIGLNLKQEVRKDDERS